MIHPCEVQARGRKFTRRLSDLWHWGHSRHICALHRPAFREHDGEHQCRCGMPWAKQASDNDAPLWNRTPR